MRAVGLTLYAYGGVSLSFNSLVCPSVWKEACICTWILVGGYIYFLVLDVIPSSLSLLIIFKFPLMCGILCSLVIGV